MHIHAAYDMHQAKNFIAIFLFAACARIEKVRSEIAEKISILLFISSFSLSLIRTSFFCLENFFSVVVRRRNAAQKWSFCYSTKSKWRNLFFSLLFFCCCSNNNFFKFFWSSPISHILFLLLELCAKNYLCVLEEEKDEEEEGAAVHLLDVYPTIYFALSFSLSLSQNIIQTHI